MHKTGKFEELLNCITWGYTDYLKQQDLIEIENPTEYNVANLLTLGMVGMLNSAINPEKTGSPEQVVSIVGLTALVKLTKMCQVAELFQELRFCQSSKNAWEFQFRNRNILFKWSYSWLWNKRLYST